jgi:nucleotide-binding universal stress UspA family protein
MPVIGDQVGLALDRIVLATDFSPASEMAASYAQSLSKRFSSTLSLVHVLDVSITIRSEYGVVGMPVEEMRQAGVENQQHLLHEMTSAGVRTTTHILESDNPASALVGFAMDLRADLIITGTNARHGLSRLSDMQLVRF